MNDYQNYLNTLKSQAGNVQNKEIVEKMETAYLVHEGVIKYFAGVDKQFKSLMQGEKINMKAVDVFLGLFEQHSGDLAGLKFQINKIERSDLSGDVELETLIQYCRQEMTIQEANYSLNELEKLSERKIQKRLQEVNEGLQRLSESMKESVSSSAILNLVKSLGRATNFCTR